MQTIVVNLIGAPGAGKSSGAAYIYAKLKMRGINAELVTEYAKDKVWEGNDEIFKNQAYIFGKQYYKQSRLLGKVNVIVTDSPLVLSVLYNNDPILGDTFSDMAHQVFGSFNNHIYYIDRVKKYNPNGRFQDEAGSDALCAPILKLLDDNRYNYARVDGNEEGYNFIIDEIIEYLLD